MRPKNTNVTTFEDHLKKRYGKRGTKKRKVFEMKAKAFAKKEFRGLE